MFASSAQNRSEFHFNRKIVDCSSFRPILLSSPVSRLPSPASRTSLPLKHHKRVQGVKGYEFDRKGEDGI